MIAVKNRSILFTTFFLLLVSGVAFLFLFVQRKIDEEDFAKLVLIREAGIYTLLGKNKPITLVRIERSSKQAFTNYDSKTLKKGQTIKLKSGIFRKESRLLWEKWKRLHNTHTPNFSFVTLKEQPNNLYFINKKILKNTLQMHYSLFVKFVGEDFSIDQIISEIDNPNSFFWKKIFKGHEILGILFGYGTENALAFARTHKVIGEAKNDNMFSVQTTKIAKLQMEKKISLKDLDLPVFRVFSVPDKQILIYEKERKDIQKQYHNHNLRKLLLQSFKCSLYGSNTSLH